MARVEGHAVVCALVGRGSRIWGDPVRRREVDVRVREPVLRNAAAAGSHPDMCGPPPLSGFPELPGPVGLVIGLVIGLAGVAELVGVAELGGVAGVVAGAGCDEPPDFPV